MSTPWNGPSTRSMIRRLQDEQARINDQVTSNREMSDLSFSYVRQDMTDVQNRITSLERLTQKFEEFMNTAKLAKPRNPSTCSSCGGPHRCDSHLCPKRKERFEFKGVVVKS